MERHQFEIIAKRAHETGVEHGFWGTDHSDAHCLMLVISELSEAVEADRKGKMADRKGYEEAVRGGTNEREAFEKYIKNTVGDELADAVIRLGDLAAARQLDFANWEYIRYVSLRIPHKNGRLLTEELFDDVARPLTGFDSLKFKIPTAVFSLLSIAGYRCIDLYWHIDKKMHYNDGREFMHGKLY